MGAPWPNRLFVFKEMGSFRPTKIYVPPSVLRVLSSASAQDIHTHIRCQQQKEKYLFDHELLPIFFPF